MSEPQHVIALRKANRIRSANATTIREIASLPRGEAREAAAALLREPTDEEAALHVGRLLRAVPRFGRERTRVILARAGIAPGREGRRIRELTERERGVIADALGAPPARRLTELQQDVLRQLNGKPLHPAVIADALGRDNATAVAGPLRGLAVRGLAKRTPAGWTRA